MWIWLVHNLIDKELAQRASVNSLMFRWRPVMSGVLQRSGLGPALFSIFGWRCEKWDKCTFRKFVCDTRLNDAVDTQSSVERRDSIQRDWDRVEGWTHANFMVRPSAGSCVWAVAILNMNTGWAMSGLRRLGCAGG